MFPRIRLGQAGLVACFAVACVCLPAFSQQPLTNPAADRVDREVQRLGGRVERDENRPGKPIIGIDLQGRDLEDSGLVIFTGLTELQELNLRGTLITDAGLVHLQGLRSLESLNLSETRITDAGLEQLGTLEKLSELTLENTPISDTGLARLAPLKKLRLVIASGTLVTMAGANALRKEIPDLEAVSIERPRAITNAPARANGPGLLRHQPQADVRAADFGFPQYILRPGARRAPVWHLPCEHPRAA